MRKKSYHKPIVDIQQCPITPDNTLTEWLDYWFENFSLRSLKQSTAISYKGYINNHIKPNIGNFKLSELSIGVLQEFINREYDCGKLTDGKEGEGLSPKTIRNINLMIHKTLKKANELDLIPKNYAEFVQLPRCHKPKVRVLTPSEHKRLLLTLQHSEEPLRFGVYLSLVTGMRLGEVLGLRWIDIDLVDNVLRIERTVSRLCSVDGEGTQLVVGTPKTDSSLRDIPFSDTVKEEFIKYRKWQDKYLKIKQPKKGDYVLMMRRGYPVEPKTMQDGFKRILDAAGIRDINFHALRHTFATRAIEDHMDPKTLSVLLGHADVSTTLNRYAHVLEQQKRKAMEMYLASFNDNILQNQGGTKL